jgi:hypothetical protein
MTSVVVDPADDAVAILSEHFKHVISGICDGTWKHYARETRRPRRTGSDAKLPRAAKFNWRKVELEAKLVLDVNPTPVFLQPRHLQSRLMAIRQKVIDSFHTFNFDHYTPRIRDVLGDAFVGVANSGIDALFPRRPRGRPRVAKLASRITLRADDADDDIDRKHSDSFLPAPADYSSSNSLPSADNRIQDILFQAIDVKSKRTYVFLQWKNGELSDGTWAKHSSLTGPTMDWWDMEVEKRWPMVDLSQEAPELRITGGIVTMIFDESS